MTKDGVNEALQQKKRWGWGAGEREREREKERESEREIWVRGEEDDKA